MSAVRDELIDQPFSGAQIFSAESESGAALMALLKSSSDTSVAPASSMVDQQISAESATTTPVDATSIPELGDFDFGPKLRLSGMFSKSPSVDSVTAWTDGMSVESLADSGVPIDPSDKKLYDGNSLSPVDESVFAVELLRLRLGQGDSLADSFLDDEGSTLPENADPQSTSDDAESSSDIAAGELDMSDAQPEKVGRIRRALRAIRSKTIRQVPVVNHGPQVEGVKFVETRRELTGRAFLSLSSIALATCIFVGLSVSNKNDALTQEEDTTTITTSTLAATTTTTPVSRYTKTAPKITIAIPKAQPAERMPAQAPESTAAQTASAETGQTAVVIPDTPSSFDMVIVDGSNFTNTVQTLLYGDSGLAADKNSEVNLATQQIIAQYAQEHSKTLKAMNHFDRGAKVTIKLTQEQRDLKRRFDLSRINAHR